MVIHANQWCGIGYGWRSKSVSTHGDIPGSITYHQPPKTSKKVGFEPGKMGNASNW